MPFKSPDKMREYQRDYQRKKQREMREKASQAAQDTDNEPDYELIEVMSIEIEQLQTVNGLLYVLAEQIEIVRNYRADPLLKARLLTSMVSAGAKVIVSIEMERRIEALEAKVKGAGVISSSED